MCIHTLSSTLSSGLILGSVQCTVSASVPSLVFCLELPQSLLQPSFLPLCLFQVQIQSSSLDLVLPQSVSLVQIHPPKLSFFLSSTLDPGLRLARSHAVSLYVTTGSQLLFSCALKESQFKGPVKTLIIDMPLKNSACLCPDFGHKPKI